MNELVSKLESALPLSEAGPSLTRRNGGANGWHGEACVATATVTTTKTSPATSSPCCATRDGYPPTPMPYALACSPGVPR